jgi:hypothetical protein
MADKPVNGCLNIITLLPTDIMYVARVSTGDDCYIKVSDFVAALLTNPVNHVTCSYNQDTEIAFGTSVKSVVIDCFFERDSYARKEIAQVFKLNTTANIVESPVGTIPDTETDIGITLSAKLDAGQLVLVVTCDSMPINTDFYYTILSQISL